MALKRMSLKVAEEMHNWIQAEADRRGLTMNAVVIFALETYYNQQRIIPHMDELMAEHKRNEDMKKDSK